MNFLNQIRKPKLSDIELITIDLTSEYMSIDSEDQLFRLSPPTLLRRIKRSVYNCRKRKLFTHRESLRKKMASCITSQDYFIVDSMPLEVCKLSRSSHSSICKEEYKTDPDKGYCCISGEQLLWLQALCCLYY